MSDSWKSLTLEDMIPKLGEYKGLLNERISELDSDILKVNSVVQQFNAKYEISLNLVNDLKNTTSNLMGDISSTGVSILGIAPPYKLDQDNGGGWSTFFNRAQGAANRVGVSGDGAVAGILLCAQHPTLDGVIKVWSTLSNIFKFE